MPRNRRIAVALSLAGALIGIAMMLLAHNTLGIALGAVFTLSQGTLGVMHFRKGRRGEDTATRSR